MQLLSRTAAACALAAAGLLIPSVASAGVAVTSGGSELRIIATGSDSHELTVVPLVVGEDEQYYVVTDTAGIIPADAGCEPWDGTGVSLIDTESVRCEANGGDTINGTLNDASGSIVIGDGIPWDYTTTLKGGLGDDVLSSGNTALVAVLKGDGDNYLSNDACTGELRGGNDTLTGSDATGPDAGDLLHGGLGADVMNGGAGDDILIGGTVGCGGPDGADVMNGGPGNDRLEGEAGNDILRGGDGIDFLRGDEGDDTLDGGLGDDELRGGLSYMPSGNDTVTYASRVEPLNLGIGAGTALDPQFFGAIGEHDTVHGDFSKIIGGASDDTITTVVLDDELNPLDPPAAITVDAGDGNDLIHAVNLASDSITCGDGADTATDVETSAQPGAPNDTLTDCEENPTTAGAPTTTLDPASLPAAIDDPRDEVEIRFSASEEATFRCSIDGTSSSLCSSPFTISGLTTGPHSFAVRATDLVGNQELAAQSYSWTTKLAGTTDPTDPTDPTTPTTPTGPTAPAGPNPSTGNDTPKTEPGGTTDTPSSSTDQAKSPAAGASTPGASNPAAAAPSRASIILSKPASKRLVVKRGRVALVTSCTDAGGCVATTVRYSIKVGKKTYKGTLKLAARSTGGPVVAKAKLSSKTVKALAKAGKRGGRLTAQAGSSTVTLTVRAS